MLHDIQKKILLELAEKDGQRYSELQIADVENDLFNYHLQYLVKIGLVKKEDGIYFITNKGTESILMLDSTGKQYEGIRASVLVYVIDRSTIPTKILIQKRLRKPYLGEVNAGISGKIIVGESIIDAAKRKLKEETGLDGECVFVGTTRKTRLSEDNTIDDAFFYVCVCEKWHGDLTQKNEFGENFWSTTDEALELQNKLQSSGKYSIQVLQNLIDNNYSTFFLEEKINIKSF